MKNNLIFNEITFNDFEFTVPDNINMEEISNEDIVDWVFGNLLGNPISDLNALKEVNFKENFIKLKSIVINGIHFTVEEYLYHMLNGNVQKIYFVFNN